MLFVAAVKLHFRVVHLQPPSFLLSGPDGTYEHADGR